MAQNNEVAKGIGVKDSLSTEISQSAEYLGSLSKAFSNAQAKLNLQDASAALATAAATLTQNITIQTSSKSE
jgi:hypothetical protein